jgi:amidohydrolase
MAPQLSAPSARTAEQLVSPLMTGLLELYLDLHRHPELSGAEQRTAARLADRLSALGCTVASGIGGHGVVGVLRNGEGPTVVLRTELDALPLVEQTSLAYTAPADLGAMHACGHDVHIACAVGAAALLAQDTDTWRGTLVVLGQPAEEDLSGAQALLDDGLERYTGRPDVILAQHVTPLPAGYVAHAPGPVTAAGATLELRVHGRGGHSGLPQLAANPVPAAAGIIVALHALQAREPVVVTIGTVHSGTRPNIIPDVVTLGLSLRAATAAAVERAIAEVGRIARACCAAAGLSQPPELIRGAESPAGVNDPEAARLVRAAHERAFGAARIAALPPSTATDDFPRLAALGGGAPVPTVYWMLGSAGAQRWRDAPGASAAEKAAALPANHSPAFAPDPAPTLRTGVAALHAAARAFLALP